MTEPDPSTPRNESVTEMLRRLGATLWAAALTLALPIGGLVLLYAYNAQVVESCRSLGSRGPVIYAVGMGVIVGIAFLPTWIQVALAGFLFGTPVGIGAGIATIVLGSAIGYAIGVAISGDRARQLVREHPRWEAVEEALLESGFWRTFWVVALVRLPSTPFAMTNLAMSALRAPIAPFLLGTLVGVTPRSVLWAMVGGRLHKFTKAEISEAGVPWWGLGLTIAGLVVGLAVLGFVAKRAMERVTTPGTPRAARSDAEAN